MDSHLQRVIDMLNQTVLKLQKQIEELEARIVVLEQR